MKIKQCYFIPRPSRFDCGFFRIGGPGLGNLLFPIARAVVKAHEYHGVFINATFPQLKIGPLVRREMDTRFYRHEFAPSCFRESIKRLILLSGPTVTEEEFSRGKALASVVTFCGLDNYFYPLMGWETLLADFLYESNCHPIPRDRKDGIAVHVRLGDFAPVDQRNAGGANTQNSVEWYRRAMIKAREILGEKTRITLFSDDPTRARREFPDIPVSAGSCNALGEMLTMSHYEALICANSTFSLWASFLSEGISIWHNKFDLGRYRPRNRMDFFV